MLSRRPILPTVRVTLVSVEAATEGRGWYLVQGMANSARGLLVCSSATLVLLVVLQTVVRRFRW